MSKLKVPLLKCIPHFGLIAASITLLYWAISGQSPLTSDDGYVMGWAVSCFILPGVVFYLIFSIFPWKWITGIKAYLTYLLLVGAYLGYVMMFGELHGPGLALWLLIVIIVLAAISLKIVEWLNKPPFLIFSSIVTLIYLIGIANIWHR